MSGYTPALRLDRVSVLNEQGRAVVGAVSFSMRRGEALALAGHIGGGKTTMLRLLAGVLTPSQGAVLVEGVDLSTLDYDGMRAHRVRTGFVFEAGGLWANRTIAENIALPLRYHDAGKSMDDALDARTKSIAEELGIEGDLTQRSSSCHASIRKRALFARALVLEPSLLLCDEPLVGLSKKEASLAAEAIERRRQARSMTVLYADHDGGIEPFVCDRTFYVEEGSLLDRPSALPPPDRPSELGLPPSSLGGSSVRGGSRA